MQALEEFHNSRIATQRVGCPPRRVVQIISAPGWEAAMDSQSIPSGYFFGDIDFLALVEDADTFERDIVGVVYAGEYGFMLADTMGNFCCLVPPCEDPDEYMRQRDA